MKLKEKSSLQFIIQTQSNDQIVSPKANMANQYSFLMNHTGDFRATAEGPMFFCLQGAYRF